MAHALGQEFFSECFAVVRCEAVFADSFSVGAGRVSDVGLPSIAVVLFGEGMHLAVAFIFG